MSSDRMKAEGQRYYRVYQGGHHDVWCNGEEHIYVSGDANGKAPIKEESRVVELRRSQCDCAKWQAIREK